MYSCNVPTGYFVNKINWISLPYRPGKTPIAGVLVYTFCYTLRSVLVDSTHLPSLNRPRGSCARRQNLKKCAAHGGRVKSYKFCQTMPIYGVITLLLPSKLVLLIGPTWSHCVNWQAPLQIIWPYPGLVLSQAISRTRVWTATQYFVFVR